LNNAGERANKKEYGQAQSVEQEEYIFLSLVLKKLLKEKDDSIIIAFKVEGNSEMERRKNLIEQMMEYFITLRRLSPTAPKVPL
jgi:predicted RNA-binding protein